MMYIENKRESNKIMIAPQTRIAFVGVVLLLIVQIVMAILNPVNVRVIMPMMFVQAIVFLIAVYAVNCTVVGKCNLYAWITSYLFVVLGLMAVIITLFKLHAS